MWSFLEIKAKDLELHVVGIWYDIELRFNRCLAVSCSVGSTHNVTHTHDTMLEELFTNTGDAARVCVYKGTMGTGSII